MARSLVIGVLVTSSIWAGASFSGRSLTEALQELQRRGLNLVFSSQVVRDTMRVANEPGASEPRELLEELLAPHGLGFREGAGGVLVVVPLAGADRVQRSSIVGYVRSRSDGHPIEGATVRLLRPPTEVRSGADGSFRFDDVEIGSHTIIAMQKGYVVERVETLEVAVDQPAEVSFVLIPAPITEEEVVVTPSRVSLLGEQPAEIFAVSREELQALPHLSNDFYRALTLLPGVTSNDVTAQFHVRGGRRDETQILLDGQELYDSFHLKDFDNALSVVALDTISRIDLSTGGYPVEYGDRMSGVLDMVTAGPSGAPRGHVALGVLSAEAGGGGSFRKRRGSWIAQLRRGTTDFAGRIFDTDAPSYWDAFGKIEHELGPRHGLRLNLLHTDDSYQIEEAVDGDFKSFQTDYRGSYAWLTHLATLGAVTYVESATSVTRIDRDRNGLEIEADLQFAVRDLRDMEVFGVRQGWGHQLTLGHALRWGFEWRDFDSEFDYRSSRQTGDTVAPGPETDLSDDTAFAGDVHENHLGAFLADRWQAPGRVVVELGLRIDRYTLTDEELLSPRVNLLYELGSAGVLRLAIGRFSQSQRPYELLVEDGETGFYPVERSEQVIIGYERLFRTGGKRRGLALRTELYRRRVGNPRPRYENLYEPLNIFPEVEPDRVRIAPERSLAQGIEVFVRGTLGPRVAWWVNYARAVTEDQIEGAWVPRRYDQRDTLNLDLDYRIGEHWRLNLAGRYHSGWPITPVALTEGDGDDGEPDKVLVFGPLNGERLPDYRRLDLRASRDWGVSFGTLTFFLDIQNVLDHRNAAGLDIAFDQEEGTLTVDREYWVGFFPSAGVVFRFRGGSRP